MRRAAAIALSAQTAADVSAPVGWGIIRILYREKPQQPVRSIRRMDTTGMKRCHA